MEASFDADSATLSLLTILQTGVASLATWLEMVCLKSNLQGSIYTDTEIEFNTKLPSSTIELSGLVENFASCAASFRAVASNPTAKPISHLHTACLTEVVGLLIS